MPALVAGYFYLLRRKRETALRYASLSMVKEAMGSGQKFRRHIPPLLFLVALIAMIVAPLPVPLPWSPCRRNTKPSFSPWTSPAACAPSTCSPIELPRRKPPPRLSSPTSRPTCASAWCPSPATASVVQAPTQNREDIIAAIDRFQLQRGTAIGSGIIVSLATIFPDAGIDVSSLIYGRNAPRGMPLDQAGKADKPEFKPVPPGSYTSAAIILLTDGQTDHRP